jgi:DNA-binding LacI/PurR family transcriptional regulator
MGKKRTSSAEVAARAGVSSMTVSRVLRGEDTVRKETRDRVIAVMMDLGYVPSAAAQALRSNDRTKSAPAGLFALIFGSGTESSVTFFHAITRGVERVAQEFDLCPIQISLYENPQELWLRLQGLFSIHDLAGALLVGSFDPEIVAFIKDNVKNIVIVDGPAPTGEGIGSVESGNLEGSLMALDYLIAAGCKNIKVITVEREHYFANAMETAASVKRSAEVEIGVQYDCHSCEAAMNMVREAWEQGDRFDGLFTNDDFAIGALKALRELHVPVPDMVRIVGFDDILYSAFTSPPLTSVHIDQYLLGEEAVRTLVSISRSGEKAKDIKKVIRPSMIIRGSA